MKFLFKLLKWSIAAVLLLWLVGLLLFRFVNPPLTLTMALVGIERGQWPRYRPVPLERINPALQRAVLVAEDSRFCQHSGIDYDAVQNAIDEYGERGRLRGASTISMQVSRNVFLWTGGGILRKGLEAPLALTLDGVWPKRRVMEIYLNIAEWGPGIFGAEAAARHYFGKPASALNTFEAARLAAILPNPIRWSASRPTAYIERRAGIIRARMAQVNRVQLACLKK